MTIKLKGSTDGSVSFTAPADTSPSGSDITLTLPTTAGSADQFVKNSGTAGTLEYSSMVETSTGVGIGTSSPSQKLEVAGAMVATGAASTYSSSGLYIQNKGSSVFDVGAWRSGASVAELSFSTDSGSDTAPVERMRINSNGNVGIGTSSPASALDVSGTTDSTKFRGRDGSASDPSICPGIDNDTGMYRPLTNSIGFATSGTERFRIMSDGDIRFRQNTTSTPGSSNTTVGLGLEYSTSGAALFISKSDNSPFMVNRNNNGTVVDLRRSGNQKGNIQVTTTGAYFNSASDYRLKENVVALSDGITRLKQLSPSRFNFIEEPSITVDGFIAHEVQAVVPEAVTGTHDEVDDDGNPVMQGMDYGKVTPLLTAALQEAIAKIETLETKVAALEAGS